MVEKIKSEPALAEFVRYCNAHPQERFWQALRNWSGYPAIMTGKWRENAIGYEGHMDTFNWKHRRHDDAKPT